MKPQEVVIGLAALAAMAYTGYGLVTETGLVGWLNYLQQSLFGSYSLKMSALVAIVGLMILGVGAWSLASRLTGRGDDGAMARLMLGPNAAGARTSTEPPQELTSKALWLTCLGMVVATWVIGYAVTARMVSAEREDAAAVYEPVVLADGVAAPQPSGTHVLLQGQLLGRHILTHRSGSGSSAREQYHLVPVAAPGWRAGQPVSYVLKVKNLYQLPGQKPTGYRKPGEAPPPPDALLGRLDGDVPVPAAQEFNKMGVMLTPTSHLVRWVPSKGDRPDVRDSSAEDFQIFIGLCSGITVLLLLCFATVAWAAARRRRKLSAGRA